MSEQPTTVMPMLILPVFLFILAALVAAVVLIVRGGAGRWVGVILLAVLALPVLGLLLVQSAAPTANVRVGQPVSVTYGGSHNQSVTTKVPIHGDAGAFTGAVEPFDVATPARRTPDGRNDGVVEVPQVFEWPAVEPTLRVETYAESHLPAVEAGIESRSAAPRVTPGAAEPRAWNLGERDAAHEPHTSTDTLYKFMAERVVASVEKVSGEGVHRITSEPGVPRELSDSISHQIHAWDGPPPQGSAKDETVVRLRWNGRTERRMTWWPTPMLKGTLEAHVSGPKGTAVVTAKLDEKPWLHQPVPGSYAVVVSETPEATAAQAQQAMKRSAEGMLYPRVQAELMRTSNGRGVEHPVLRQQVLWAAQSNVGVLDECVVRVDRPYGPVYYAAQLRDVGAGALQPIASASVAASTARRQSFAGMILGLGGMVLVLGLLYLALNALTRGYFRGRLRVATAVAALLAGAVVLVLIG